MSQAVRVTKPARASSSQVRFNNGFMASPTSVIGLSREELEIERL